MFSEMFIKLRKNGVIQRGIWETIYMTVISMVTTLGYSAMAATIGGAGLGHIAVSYGRQRFNPDITRCCFFLTVIIVQAIRETGTWIARKNDKRYS